jgi:hypothetical protein
MDGLGVRGIRFNLVQAGVDFGRQAGQVDVGSPGVLCGRQIVASLMPLPRGLLFRRAADYRESWRRAVLLRLHPSRTAFDVGETTGTDVVCIEMGSTLSAPSPVPR